MWTLEKGCNFSFKRLKQTACSGLHSSKYAVFLLDEPLECTEKRMNKTNENKDLPPHYIWPLFATGLFLYPLSRKYRKRPVVQNGLECGLEYGCNKSEVA